MVELEPKEKLANLEFIQLEVDPENHHLKTLLLMDRQGNYRTILLKEIKYNLDLDPNSFISKSQMEWKFSVENRN